MSRNAKISPRKQAVQSSDHPPLAYPFLIFDSLRCTIGTGTFRASPIVIDYYASRLSFCTPNKHPDRQCDIFRVDDRNKKPADQKDSESRRRRMLYGITFIPIAKPFIRAPHKTLVRSVVTVQKNSTASGKSFSVWLIFKNARAQARSMS